MSDPVTNVEIEDVLSSIRRLVSEGERSPAARPELKSDSRPAVAQNARFVLTPALRVVERDDTSATPAGLRPAAEAAPAAPRIRNRDRSLSQLEATIAELEAAVTLQADDFEPDGSEANPAQEWTDAPQELRRRITEVEVDDAQLVEPEPEPGPSTAGSAPADDPDVFHLRSNDETEDDHQDELVKDADDDFGPDHAAGPDSADELDAYLDDQDHGTIDESALRDMVSQIVRQELQGELGERITRNVRKLVRREIYRVINSQEFE